MSSYSNLIIASSPKPHLTQWQLTTAFDFDLLPKGSVLNIFPSQSSLLGLKTQAPKIHTTFLIHNFWVYAICICPVGAKSFSNFFIRSKNKPTEAFVLYSAAHQPWLNSTSSYIHYDNVSMFYLCAEYMQALNLLYTPLMNETSPSFPICAACKGDIVFLGEGVF